MSNDHDENRFSTSESLALSILTGLVTTIIGLLLDRLAPDTFSEWYIYLLLYLLLGFALLICLIVARRIVPNAVTERQQLILCLASFVLLLGLSYTTPIVFGYAVIQTVPWCIILFPMLFFAYVWGWQMWLKIFYPHEQLFIPHDYLCYLVTSIAYFLGTITLLVPYFISNA